MKEVHIKCKGRGPLGQDALQKPIPITLTVRAHPFTKSDMISCAPADCPYLTGGHGQRCKASHPTQDKVGDGVLCPFSFDYPYVLEYNPTWTPPSEVAKALNKVKKSAQKP